MSASGSNANPEPVIAMSGVAVSALSDPARIVAEGIDWAVQAGDYWVIAALQGGGKTDFMLMTAGLMAPAAGQYKLFGEPMPIFDEARLRQRLRLGLVFDSGQLLNHLTIWENLALPVRYHLDLSAPACGDQVQAMIELMELQPWAQSAPSAIGRNWQKRAGLGRALMLRPEILLIDSPLAGLDLRHTAWWLNFLERLTTGKIPGLPPITLVVTGADFRPWQGRARQFAALRQGRFAVLGAWRQVETAGAELWRELLLGAPARD